MRLLPKISYQQAARGAEGATAYHYLRYAIRLLSSETGPYYICVAGERNEAQLQINVANDAVQPTLALNVTTNE